MGLDVYLVNSVDGSILYEAGITHNLGKMATEAGLYKPLWRPEEMGISRANQLIEPLTSGVILLATEQARFKKLNPANGWGSWSDFLPWVADYLQACKDNPEAVIEVSR